MSIEGVKEVYPCDGVQTEFAITFPFASDREVSAFISNRVTGERRRLVRNLDYTIRGTTLVLRHDDFREPWSADWDLCIMSRARIEQGSSQAMSPATFAKRVNQLTQMLRQIHEQTLRTLHIGQKYPSMNLVSKLYPYQFEDSATGIGGGIDAGRFPPHHPFASASAGIGGFIVGGTMREPVIEYPNWPPDVCIGIGGELTGGTLRAPVVTYSDWPADAVIGVGGELTAGTMIAPVVAYTEWPADEVIGIGGELTAGTLD